MQPSPRLSPFHPFHLLLDCTPLHFLSLESDLKSGEPSRADKRYVDGECSKKKRKRKKCHGSG